MKLNLVKWIKIVLTIGAVNAIILVGLAFADVISNSHNYFKYSYWFVIPAGLFFVIGMCLVLVFLMKKRLRRR